MSPYLFAMAMENLSRFLNTLIKKDGLKFHPKCSRIGTKALLFVDFILLVLKVFKPSERKTTKIL